MYLEYLKILEQRPKEDRHEAIVFMKEQLKILHDWIEMYLNYTMATSNLAKK